MKSRFPTRQHKHHLSPMAAGVAALLLAGCGGGSGDNNSNGDSSLIVDGGSGVPADDVDTSLLLRKAADGSSTSLSKNLSGMQQIGGNSSSMSMFLDAVELDSTSALVVSDDETDDDDAEPVTSDQVLSTDVEDDVSSLVDALLGLSGGLAEVSRTGNHITVDPDDAAFCEQELLDEMSTANDIADCESLMSNVLVEVDALTEDSGLITITFAQQDLLLVGYSPVTANYEVKLPGVQSLLTQIDEIEGGDGSVPSMQGAIRLSATVLDDTEEAESASFSLSVTEALSIVDNAGTDLSLQPSTLLSVTSDAATNSGSVELDVGALNATVASINDAGQPSSAVLAFAGLSARMDIGNNGDSLTVSNVGIGNGPLTLTIDSVEQLRVMLQTFGFSIQGEPGLITLDDDLDFVLTSGSVNTLSAQAPSGTAFAGQDNGSSQVLVGGPLLISIVEDSSGSPVTDSISIGTGDCFMADDDSDSTLPFVMADCGL